MPGPIDELNEALYSLAGRSRLFPEDIEFLTQCLHSKWHPIQVVAAKVLVKFHPPEALPLLKEWLMRHAKNHQMSYAGQKALMACITASDLPWIYDLYLTKRAGYYLFLIGALVQFPNQDIIGQLILDCHQKYNIESITVLAAVLVKDKETILKKLLAHPKVSHKAYVQRCFGWGAMTKDQILKFKNPL